MRRDCGSGQGLIRLIPLYLRSRGTVQTATIIVVIAFLTWLVAHWLLSRKGFEPPHLTLVMNFASLAMACVVGAGVRAPFGEVESIAVRWMSTLRFGHLAGLLVLASLSLCLVSSRWERDYAAWVLIRNLLGLSGAAFLAAHAFGGQWGWSLPVGFSAILPFVGKSDDGKWLWWVWTGRPVGDSLSWTIALLLLIFGLGVVSKFGSREMPGELE